MNDLILHHYPPSPVSEKVRVALGVKNLSWQSVIIPRIPPKPKLIPLTGGFRLTPVMQIGADIYCDSQCILRELERRFPQPTLFPGGDRGPVWGLGRWLDGEVFTNVLALVFAEDMPGLPEGFAEDRFSLYFNPGETKDSLADRLPENLALLRSQMSWVDNMLADRSFLSGEAPGMSDAYVYYLVWFTRERFSGGPSFLQEFENILNWEMRIKEIGHGQMSDISADDALEIARRNKPEAGQGVDVMDPMDLGRNAVVAISSKQSPDEVVGNLITLSANEVTVLREDSKVGSVAVHLPRVGYHIREV